MEFLRPESPLVQLLPFHQVTILCTGTHERIRKLSNLFISVGGVQPSTIRDNEEALNLTKDSLEKEKLMPEQQEAAEAAQ